MSLRRVCRWTSAVAVELQLDFADGQGHPATPVAEHVDVGRRRDLGFDREPRTVDSPFLVEVGLDDHDRVRRVGDVEDQAATDGDLHPHHRVTSDGQPVINRHEGRVKSSGWQYVGGAEGACTPDPTNEPATTTRRPGTPSRGSWTRPAPYLPDPSRTSSTSSPRSSAPSAAGCTWPTTRSVVSKRSIVMARSMSHTPSKAPWPAVCSRQANRSRPVRTRRCSGFRCRRVASGSACWS